MTNIIILVLAFIGFINVCKCVCELGWNLGRKNNKSNDDELVGGGFAIPYMIPTYNTDELISTDNAIAVNTNEDKSNADKAIADKSSDDKPKRKYNKKKKAIVAEETNQTTTKTKKKGTSKKKQEE